MKTGDVLQEEIDKKRAFIIILSLVSDMIVF
jgi:hypothetical protein